MNRRDLIMKAFLGGTTLILAPSVFTYCSKDDGPLNNGGGGDTLKIDLTIAPYTILNTTGGSVVTQGKIIANTGSNVFVALDSTCTHEGCTIGYNQAANNFPCPCHGSIYSTSGAVVNGPAPRAVKSYPVSKSGDILTITLS